MDQESLSVTKRDALGSRNSARLRRSGRVPGIVYGHKQDSVAVSADTKSLTYLLHEGVRIVTLDIDGTTEPALIRDVHYDTFGDEILHVDFARIALDEEIHVQVDIEFHGTPAGIREGGVLDLGIHQIELACLPTNIPDQIRAELAGLDVGDSLHVRDLTPPPGVRFLAEEDTVVALVRLPLKAVEVVEEAAPVEGEAAEAAPGEAEEGEGGNES